MTKRTIISLSKKEHLEYYLETTDFEESKLLYKDINSFNDRLKEYKANYNNLWTNWFFNKKIASINYIELEHD